MQLDGDGKLGFCPCLGTPLAVSFSGATVAPPHDVILRNPVLELFGVPIAWAPAIWLRSPGRVGLLAPELAWRGADGFFAGGGVHVPWQPGDVLRGVDVRAGGYVDGGVAVETGVRTATTNTGVRWDRLRGDDGLSVQARGATAMARSDDIESVAWEVDALRGARSVKATTDVDAAARPFDRAQGEAAWRSDGWTLSSGVRTVAPRGGNLLGLGVGGPEAAARRAGAIGHVGAYDATFEGGQLAGGGFGATSFARAEGGALVSSRLGPVGGSLAIRWLGDLADDGNRSGLDGAAQGRLAIALPMVRPYRSSDEADPWIHRTEPHLEVSAIATHAEEVLVVPPGRGAAALSPSGGAWVAAGGWSNAVGRWGSRAATEVEATGGAVGDDRRSLPALRARVAMGGQWLGVRGDFARVLGSAAEAGGALVTGVRVGPASGLHVAAHLAQRDGIDPLVARALVDAPLEPSSGFLVASGWTGGVRAALPLGTRITTRGGADFDLDARALVDAALSLELHDPCNCVVVRASVAHRIGRDGVDAWINVDLPLASAAPPR
jgi:hypothetical protein